MQKASLDSLWTDHVECKHKHQKHVLHNQLFTVYTLILTIHPLRHSIHPLKPALQQQFCVLVACTRSG